MQDISLEILGVVTNLRMLSDSTKMSLGRLPSVCWGLLAWSSIIGGRGQCTQNGADEPITDYRLNAEYSTE